MPSSTLSDPVAPGHDVSQIQAELLSLLNSPGPAPTGPGGLTAVAPPLLTSAAPPAAAPEGEAGSAEAGCPSCGFTGSWGMGSWCPKCGYFPRLGREGEVVPDPNEAVDELPPPVWELVAGWIWILIGGMVAIVATSLLLPVLIRDPLQRGSAAISQIFIGTLLVVFSQIRAYMLCARTSENFKFYSIVTSPLAIWRGAIKLLPDSKTVFFMAAWGWTASLSGGFLVGVHWPIYLKAFQEQMREQREAEAAAKAGKPAPKEEEKKKEPGEMTFGEFVGEIGKSLAPPEEKPKMKFRDGKGEGKEDMDEAMNKLLEDVPADMKAEDGDGGGAAGEGKGGEGEAEDGKAEEKVGQRCLIIGYTANGSGEVRSLLLAAPLRDGRLRFAAKLPLDSLTNRDLTELRRVLQKIRTRQQACACPFGGVWVQPVLQCRVLNEGWTSDGRLRNPHIEELILESTQAPAPRSASTSRTVR